MDIRQRRPLFAFVMVAALAVVLMGNAVQTQSARREALQAGAGQGAQVPPDSANTKPLQPGSQPGQAPSELRGLDQPQANLGQLDRGIAGVPWLDPARSDRARADGGAPRGPSRSLPSAAGSGPRVGARPETAPTRGNGESPDQDGGQPDVRLIDADPESGSPTPLQPGPGPTRGYERPHMMFSPPSAVFDRDFQGAPGIDPPTVIAPSVPIEPSEPSEQEAEESAPPDDGPAENEPAADESAENEPTD